MGKSSLKVRVMQRLVNEGVACSSIDVSGQGSKDNVTQEQWYTGIVSKIVKDLQIAKPIEFRRTWWRDRHDISPVQRLDEFIEDVLLSSISGNIIIFIDEIDSTLSLGFASEDFFALIRSCYNKRAENPAYKRLTFALLGVATPGDLIQDKTRTPFNIGEAIELDGFKIHEIEPLAKGLTGKVENPQAVMQEVLAWTGGQPFLTQRVCELLGKALSIERRDFQSVDENQIIELVKEIIHNQIIDNWEANDKQEHLKTIRDRLLISEEISVALLGLYQQILQQVEMTADSSFEQMRLRLTGLVVQQQGKLRVYNQIYGNVFDINWVENELGKLRFYADKLRAWVESNYQDNSCLLWGEDLEKARVWADGRKLSDVDYRFLSASLEAELNQKVVKAETRLNQALREEIKAKKNTRIGLIVLVISIIGSVAALMFANWANDKRLTAQQGVETARNNAKAVTKKADDRVKNAEDKVKISEQKIQDKNKKLEDINRKLHKRNQEFAQRIQEVKTLEQAAKKAQIISKYAQTKLQQAEKRLKTSENQLNKTKQEQQAALREKQEAEQQRQNVQIITLLEQTGIRTLRQFYLGEQIENLVTIIAAGRELKNLMKGKTSLADYPAYNPFFTLQEILLNIRERNELKGHRGIVPDVAFSPDGKTLASASVDKTIKLWNVSTGKEITSLTGHQDQVFSIAFSPDGKTLASGSADKTIKLWNVSTGKEIASLTGHQNRVFSVAFSPDGKTLASASMGLDKNIKLWDVSTGKEINSLTGHIGGVISVVFSPDGKTLASTSEDTTIKLWNVRTGEEITSLANNQYGYAFTSVAFSPDGKILASGSGDKTIKLWNVSTRKEIASLNGHQDIVFSVAFSLDGKTLASASKDNTIKLWNIARAKEITSLTGHQNSVETIVFSPDGKTLASASADNTIKLWSLDLDDLLAQGCNYLQDYLATRDELRRQICPNK
ncbi:AAA-like domain-containing protein [Nostoc sp. FACHB-190]|uniref:WD40 domain-containing protein n=1 Tax=Nostoc sp. FACHB-190 TaxID=2692838 RepID=UPI001A7EC676|nr:AAA-like domain-containing protein [Nostoc sp. FACHB-190]